MDFFSSIDSFDGTGNFRLWERQVRTALQAKGVHSAVLTDKGALEEQANGMALFIIRGALGDDFKNAFPEMSAFELWNELRNLFSTAKTSKVVKQLTKLLACSMAPGDREGRVFTALFKACANELET
ncbi:hypothetical protein GQ54DRAFT_250764, partial [Martensiomyces pterosporus]